MSSYQQILAGTSVSITETFSVDGTAINVDSGLPTLTLTKPDGTAYTPVPTVLNSWAGPPARAVGEYRFVLPAQPDPYYLDYKLVGTIGGQPQTFGGRVEWVGASLFNLADLRGLKVAGGFPFALTADYSNQQLQDTRAAVLDEFTDILGFSPVPRYYREVVSAYSWADVVLTKGRPVTKLLSITVSGTSTAASGYYLGPGGALLPRSAYAVVPWSATGLGNVAVEYVAGWDRVEGNGSRMAMLYAAAQLNPAGFSSASTVSLPTGESFSYEPSEVGRNGFQRWTGIRDVDRWLNLHTTRGRLGVA
jgi:hypothetical protein